MASGRFVHDGAFEQVNEFGKFGELRFKFVQEWFGFAGAFVIIGMRIQLRQVSESIVRGGSGLANFPEDVLERGNLFEGHSESGQIAALPLPALKRPMVRSRSRTCVSWVRKCSSENALSRIRIASEAFLLPEIFRYQREVGAFLFFRQKIAAENRANAQHIEIVGGQSAAKYLDRIAKSGQRERKEILRSENRQKSSDRRDKVGNAAPIFRHPPNRAPCRRCRGEQCATVP